MRALFRAGRFAVPAAVALFLSGTALPLSLEAQGVAVGLRAGTDGIGANVTAGLAPSVNLRVGATFFSHSQDGVERLGDQNTEWTADGTLLFVSALADWYPFGGGFRLSGGAAYNGLEADGDIQLQEAFTSQGRTYTPEEVGTLQAKVTPGSAIAPYAGLGFGNALTRSIGFQVDLGVMYMGSPKVDLTGSGMIAPTAAQGPQIEENLESYKWYPVLSVGLSRRVR